MMKASSQAVVGVIPWVCVMFALGSDELEDNTRQIGDISL